MKYFVYFLKSIKDEHYYIGCTTNPEKRLIEHNSGSNQSTKKWKLWKLIYTEEYDDKHSAFKREWHLKHPKGYLDKINIIKNYGSVA